MISSTPSAPPLPPTASVAAGSDIHLFDTLASARRLWLRGRIVPTLSTQSNKRTWWRRLRRGTPDDAATPLQVRTQIAGDTLQAETTPGVDGLFEVLYETHLPTARRGWRVARNQILRNGITTRACSVVLIPPAEAKAAIVVIPPLAFSHDSGGAQRALRCNLTTRLAQLLPTPGDDAPSCPIYYLCAIPAAAGNLQPELALAATALGWPSGHFVLMPASRDTAVEALAHGLDRLRWLFADNLELRVLNLEPQAETALKKAVSEQADRASVGRFVGVSAAVPGGVPACVIAPRGLRPLRARCVPRHPLVFCHGMLAMSLLRMSIPEDTNYFVHLRPFLNERGVQALFPNVEPTGGVAARAEQLRDLIRGWTEEPINLIAHSMGGLDARYLVAHLGLAGRVRSLTTIATPHRGSSLAEWFCLNFRQRVPLLLTLEALGINVDGFRDCRPSVCQVFNERTPDASGVHYYSYGGAVTSEHISPLLRRAWNIMTPLEGPNDGLVSVRSAHWGEYLGTLAVDHFAQTPDGLFLRPGESFDPLGFYSRLIEDLARRGF